MSTRLHLEQTTLVAHPGYSAMWGSTGGYKNPPAPYFICRYDDAPKGAETTRRFTFVDLLPEEGR